MKPFFVVIVLLIACASAIESPVYREWIEWKQKYQPRYYSNSEDEKRFKIFAKNRQTVLELNKQCKGDPSGLSFALNKFADLSEEEFAVRYLRGMPTDVPRKYLPRLLSAFFPNCHALA